MSRCVLGLHVYIAVSVFQLCPRAIEERPLRTASKSETVIMMIFTCVIVTDYTNMP